MTFALITLLAALSLAAVADWFSIIGFMTIYAASPMHALIMGIVLALAKLVTTSWVYRNWKFADWKLKTPLIGFVFALMIATSIGTFGFLSKAHLDQGGGTIDNGAKVERLEQQIAREKSVITDDEKVIAQLDNTINSYIGKDRTDKSLAVRKSQAPQRKQLRDDIDASQKRIDTFSDERLKLQSEVRKQQLDVGPIRYIAELFYGVAEDASKNIEAAVRLFTLLIVSTLDPLAVILLVAANHTLLRIQDEKENTYSTKDNILSEDGTIVADVPTPIVEHDAQVVESTIPDLVITEIPEVIHEEEKSPTQDKQHRSNDELIESGRITAPNEEQRKEVEVSISPPEQVSDIPPMEGSVVGERPEEDAIPVPILPKAMVSLNEEENTVLETNAFISNSPMPIIRSPHLTRISSRQVSTGPVEETTTVEESIYKDAAVITTHFIPQKVNEEEKSTQIEPPGAKTHIREATSRTTPAYEKIFGEGQKIVKEETKVQSTHKGVVGAVASHKYPITSSWLAEFKRSQNGQN